MSMPYYVAPEQAMKDRADFARKGISRGRALVALRFENGIVLVAENASQSLRKVSEIYDRIAFAGVGKYNEFDQLRVAGIRSAELTGYQYSRDDVDARGLANDYAQLLGNSFTHGMKPMEVEILVAEVGIDGGHDDQIFHIMYDGTVIDRPDTCALGGFQRVFKPGSAMAYRLVRRSSSESRPYRVATESFQQVRSKSLYSNEMARDVVSVAWNHQRLMLSCKNDQRCLR
jgi:proteasome alpha subunit